MVRKWHGILKEASLIDTLVNVKQVEVVSNKPLTYSFVVQLYSYIPSMNSMKYGKMIYLALGC